METDVVVVGSGFAGFAAAIEAHDAGADVTMLEKMPLVGGNSIIAGGGINAVDPIRQALDNLEDSIQQHYDQTLWGGDYRGDPARVKRLVEEALAQVEWCEKEGITFADRVVMHTGSLFPRGHKAIEPGSSGRGLIMGLEAAAIDRGITILTDHMVTGIIREEPFQGGVLGVEVEANGDTLYFKARKAVVMGSGGFGHDYRLLNLHYPVITEAIPSTNHIGATGECLMYGQDVGAHLVGMDFIQIHPYLGAPKPGRFSVDARYNIMVNAEGNRFVAEDARRDVQSDAAFAQTDGTFWMIWDDWGRKDLGKTDEVVEENVAAGNIFRGDTLEELAEQIGTPAENLVSAVTKYNQYVEAGEDPEFGKAESSMAFKLEVPPFYAHLQKPGIHHTMGGMLTNVEAQVIDRFGEPIPRFYAAGEATGGIHGTNRLGGNATPDCLVFGRTAGANAAAEEPWG